MPTLDINKYDNTKTNPETSPEPLQSSETLQEGQGMVTLSGPLSKVYAEALIEVMGENTTALSTETNQIESQAILLVDDKTPEPINAIVYVTDHEKIRENPSETFSQLRIALDAQAKKKYVVLESQNSISSVEGLIHEYAVENCHRVFYSRESFLRHMAR